ncbi:iron uptake transporter deferrochelatase/peroxidase subunit [Macrococcus brunensis]|uniref:iron uptake transporter deferrochelatase/peroxidase subunit n=1 Tax=Macrococcus brunensis TaxID=198483 RepID=UPI001EF0FD20|nr:iron uptake transporter deferrochelatase/peroxidase subunit [Macrococcus brunensis]ULG72074.1 iron uptake transporter deferrochelatase/peroxidase subunit [Macrococcus brunensis]
MTKENSVSRRDFLKLASIGGAGVLVGSTGLGTSLYALNHFGRDNQHSKNKVNFYGKHQSGIVTDVQKHVYFVVLELSTDDVQQVKKMFQDWTTQSVKLMNGDVLAETSKNTLLPSVDTGEAVGLDASRLTLTYGISAEFFKKLGIEHLKPKDFVDLPHFPKDQLNPKYTGGHIFIQACSDDPQVNFHAVRNLVRASRDIISMKWSQTGFNSYDETKKTPDTPRNLFSFKDGTGNPKFKDTETLDCFVFIDQDWAKNGSYLVVRRIQMHIETWDRTSLEDQERTFGRHRDSGAPIGMKKEYDEIDIKSKNDKGELNIPEDSHVHLAKKANTTIMRRSFSYSDGINEATGTFDAGLLFVSFQKSPEQFIKLQSMMGRVDRLNEYITHRGSGVFLAFPGIKEGGYIGEALFNRL